MLLHGILQPSSLLHLTEKELEEKEKHFIAQFSSDEWLKKAFNLSMDEQS